MNYEKAYKEALESAKGIINYYKEHNRGDESAIEDLEIIFPELKESEDKRIKKELTKFLKNASGGFLDTTIRCKTFGKWAAWLEKQKAMDKEIVFRPLAGTDIIVAAKQALEKIEIGKEVILAFNGAYIPVNDKTVSEICNEYDAWLEKQGKKKPTWSDEDDKTYYSLLADIRARQDSSTSTLEAYYNEQINWLKSLKERLS